MAAGRFSAFGIIAAGVLALSGCNADQNAAVTAPGSRTVVRTVTATRVITASTVPSAKTTRHSEPASTATERSTHTTPPPAPLAARSTPTAAAPRASVRTTQTPRRTTVRPPAPAKTTATTGACNIKGNISSKGEKIYHMPGQRYYNITKISLGKGERWFCSEQDAVSAGWRKALV